MGKSWLVVENLNWSGRLCGAGQLGIFEYKRECHLNLGCIGVYVV